MPASPCSSYDEWGVGHGFPVANVLALPLVSPSTDICLCLTRAAVTRSICPDKRAYKFVSQKPLNPSSNIAFHAFPGYKKGKSNPLPVNGPSPPLNIVAGATPIISTAFGFPTDTAENS
jgi:hypothetical protein